MERLKFNLRRQLVLVSLLLLTLPWAGCQFVREMEGALRQGQEQALQATARAVAAVAGERRQLIYPDPARIDAPPDLRPKLYASPAESSEWFSSLEVKQKDFSIGCRFFPAASSVTLL